MTTADGTKLGSILRAMDDRSNIGDWERLELGIDIEEMRFLQKKLQASIFWEKMPCHVGDRTLKCSIE